MLDGPCTYVMRKPALCICENKDADQLCGNRTADQRFCFNYTDSTISLLSGERGGLVVNASDSISRGRGFEPHSGQTVLCP